MNNEGAVTVAEELSNFYRIPRHDLAVDALTAYVSVHGHENLPVMWHHFARALADVYTMAGLVLLPPEGPAATDPYEVHDEHALRLTILCQENKGDALSAIRDYAKNLGPDADPGLWEGITLCLAHKVTEGESPEPQHR